MRSRFVRLILLAISFVAPLSWVAQADADTTATVEITGEVVDASLSLTFSAASFSLGEVDATGDVYDPATSLAEPFEIGPNGFLVPQGLAWVAKAPLAFTVLSSVEWRLSFCSSAQTATLDGSTPLLFMAVAVPATVDEAPILIGLYGGVKSCSSSGHGSITGMAGDLGYDVRPTYIVRANDTPHAFSATVQFTLSPL